jgi:hypothetical protein
VGVTFKRLEYLRVSWIFSHSGASRAPSVTKASWLAANYTRATPPPLRQKLNQQGSFEVTGLQTIVPEQPLEESTILDLEATALGPVETPTTDFLAPFIVPIQFHECQTVSHTTMETNFVTPSGNSSIPTTIVTLGELSSPNPPSSVRATMVSTATTLHSGMNPYLAVATTPFTPSATGPQFSYRMPSSGTSPYFPTPLYRLWVWGQGALVLLCKVTWGALLSLLTIFLMEEVISLLRPLHSVARISNPPGNLHIIVYLERGVKDHLRIVCQ